MVISPISRKGACLKAVQPSTASSFSRPSGVIVAVVDDPPWQMAEFFSRHRIQDLGIFHADSQRVEQPRYLRLHGPDNPLVGGLVAIFYFPIYWE